MLLSVSRSRLFETVGL